MLPKAKPRLIHVIIYLFAVVPEVTAALYYNVSPVLTTAATGDHKIFSDQGDILQAEIVYVNIDGQSH
jgi:hypothetical protein